MDAGFVIAPPPPPTATAGEPAPEAQDADATAFADHLSREAPAKTAQRKPGDKPAAGADENAEGPAPQGPVYALAVATAPVIVRLDAGPAITDVTFKAAPTVIAPAIEAGALPPQAPANANAAPPTAASTAGAASALAVAPTAPTAPTPPGSAAAEPQPAPAAPAPLAADLLASSIAPVTKAATPTAPLEPLRASGRQRGDRTETSTVEAPRAAAATAPAVAVAAAAARSGPNRDAATPGPATSEQPSQMSAPSETAPTSGEARKLAEHPAPAVHRPPTPAMTVAQHIVRRFDGQSTSIDVRLDPAELGAVHVKLDVGADHRVTAIVAADNPATLADLMRSARDLERALESAGLELASGGLSFDLSDRRGASDADQDAEATAGLRGSSDEADVSPAPASRPFGLEAWRGVRVDMTV